MMKRGICTAMFGVLVIGAVMVATGGAQVYPVRWQDEAVTAVPKSSFDSIHATTLHIVTPGVPFECNEETAGYLAVFAAPGTPPTDPPTGTRSHYLCICAYVYNETPPGPPHPGWMWALTDADNNPIEDCYPESP